MERVAKKSFIFTTLLMPVLMLLMMVLPALIMEFSTPDKKTVAVSDASGRLAMTLARSSNDDLTFVPITARLGAQR